MSTESFATDGVIYKYRAVNINSISLLVNRELYFASPKQLNDPHDCQIDVAAALKQALEKSHMCHVPPDRKEAITAFNKLYEDVSFIEDVKRRIDEVAICSFSTLPNNALMWTHYADQHRGFCLGFDPGLIRERRPRIMDCVLPWHVVYTDGNPFYSILNNPLNIEAFSSDHAMLFGLIQMALTRKSTAWSYEKEFRFVRMVDGCGFVKFDPSAVVEIVLGCNMSEYDRKTLLNLLKAPEWSHVWLREVIKSPTSFTFRIVSL